MPEGCIPVKIRFDMILCLSDCNFAVLAVEVERMFRIGGGIEGTAECFVGDVIAERVQRGGDIGIGGVSHGDPVGDFQTHFLAEVLHLADEFAGLTGL